MPIVPSPEDSRAVTILDTEDLHATVTPNPSRGDVELAWNDHVANSWTEAHPTLAAALTRLAEVVSAP